MQLVSNPWQFDVVILTNLYGNIVSNLVAGLIGGPGLIGGSNYGPQYAVFETGTRNAAQVIQILFTFTTLLANTNKIYDIFKVNILTTSIRFHLFIAICINNFIQQLLYNKVNYLPYIFTF